MNKVLSGSNLDVREFEELILTPGVSGYEEKIREKIAEKLKGILEPDKILVDSIGNLIVKVGRGRRRIALIAHMDELGLIVTKIERDGRIAFRKMGGINDQTLIGTQWEILTEKGRVNGVIGIKPPHLMLGEPSKILPWHQLRIDIGVESREEAEKLGVKILDPIVYKKTVLRLANNQISARSLDDRFGCFALLETLRKRIDDLKRDDENEVYFIWSVQEEIGLKGARVIANTLRPNITFAVDSFPCCSTLTGDVMVGRGPVVRAIDRSSISSRDLVRFIQKISEENEIPLQIGATGGGNDGSVCQERGSKLAVIGVPMKYSHSLVETISLNDLEKLIELLQKILERIREYP
ncbi:MAG: M42 family metallopeptidase [Candidatus Verstraetearchaeota archaeon]|nr:M42 family metallopeptidase [Candidatus Verstraetearchaeota archaeon]